MQHIGLYKFPVSLDDYYYSVQLSPKLFIVLLDETAQYEIGRVKQGYGLVEKVSI